MSTATGGKGFFTIGALLMRLSFGIVPFSGVPTSGTSGTYAGRLGIGSLLVNVLTGDIYSNQGTKASPLWVIIAGGSVEDTVTTNLAAADITTLHSVPKTIVAAPGAGKVNVLSELTLEFTYGTVQFTGGGAISAQYHGTSANLLGSTLAAATVQAAVNASMQFDAANTAGGNILVTNTAIELVAATADFAAGDSTMKSFAKYRTVTL